MSRLHQSGHEAYVVGGSVRDFLLGRPSKDHDIATSAKPDEVCALFSKAITVGKAFGVIKVPMGEDKFLEISTFREDLGYKDHRHPEGVRFCDAETDALRRDFTINALYLDFKSSRILDFTGGLDDLSAKVLRTVGVPKDRFTEDALRLMRAVRFSTELGFKLEEKTEQAVILNSKLIAKVSGERIREELSRMWLGRAPAEALTLLERTQLLKHVLPEVNALVTTRQIGDHERDLWRRVMEFLPLLRDLYPDRSWNMAWAGVLWHTGKPVAAAKNRERSFHGHELEGADVARTIAKRMGFSVLETERLAWTLANQLKVKEVHRMREATLQRMLREPGFEDLLKLHRVDSILTDGNLAPYDFWQQRLDQFKREGSEALPKLIDGTDLIQMGFNPGPQFSEILSTVEDMALEGKLLDKDQALEYVVKRYVV